MNFEDESDAAGTFNSIGTWDLSGAVGAAGSNVCRRDAHEAEENKTIAGSRRRRWQLLICQGFGVCGLSHEGERRTSSHDFPSQQQAAHTAFHAKALEGAILLLLAL